MTHEPVIEEIKFSMTAEDMAVLVSAHIERKCTYAARLLIAQLLNDHDFYVVETSWGLGEALEQQGISFRVSRYKDPAEEEYYEPNDIELFVRGSFDYSKNEWEWNLIPHGGTRVRHESTGVRRQRCVNV